MCDDIAASLVRHYGNSRISASFADLIKKKKAGEKRGRVVVRFDVFRQPPFHLETKKPRFPLKTFFLITFRGSFFTSQKT